MIWSWQLQTAIRDHHCITTAMWSATGAEGQSTLQGNVGHSYVLDVMRRAI